MRNISWAAGILEGEACFLAKRGRTPAITVQMTDLDVLEELQRVFDAGHIVETRVAKEHYKRTWVWNVSKEADAARIMREILPYMMARRSERITSILVTYSKVCEAREQKASAKLARDKEIVRLRVSGMLTQDIANELGVSRAVVSKTLNPKAL